MPTILSEAQHGILENAATHPLSVAIGPPGTGKSFTIAALTLDALARSESVLVASKMHHAVDVVADKIEHLLGLKSFVIRGGRRQYRKDLVLAVRSLLNGVLPILPPEHPDEMQRVSRALTKHHHRIERFEDLLEKRRERELAWGRDTLTLDEGIEGSRRLLLRMRAAWHGHRLTSATPYWDLMKSRPHRAPADCLEYRRVPGRRLEDGSNPVEAEALVEALLADLAAEAERPRPLRHTVGVLSPFRAQVDLLSKLLSRRLDQRILERHGVRVGTPFAFQGEERDHMFLSLVLDADSHPAAFRFLDRADVFNVAVTRARSRQLVFGSLDPKEPKARDLLRRFLVEHLHAPPEPREPPAPDTESDPFLRAVRTLLEVRGFRLWPRYPIAGLEVDLVLERDGHCLGIDLVGHPGEFAPAFALERYRILERAGLRLFPLPWSAWRRDPEACLGAIESAWQESAGSRLLPTRTPHLKAP